MEIDSFLHKVQGYLQLEQQNSCKLDSLKKDKEEETTKVISGLRKIIENEDFSLQTKRKLFILLFLNTDTEIYPQIKKNRKLAYLVGFLPKLHPELFISIIAHLQLQCVVYESVEFFPSALSYKVLQLCIESLNWLDLFDTVTLVENLLLSLFRKIIVLDENDEFNSHLKDAFQRLLLHFDAEKGGSIKRMRTWKSPKLKHYAGTLAASLLTLVENCTNVYFKTNDASNESGTDIYRFSLDHAIVLSTESVENRLISVEQCYEHVVAKCHENICAITIDIWLFWVEIDLDDEPDTENTLQRLVGERAYSCRQLLVDVKGEKSLPKEASDLISRLENISIKPEPEDVGPYELEDVLNNIETPGKDKTKWLKYLINNTSFTSEPRALNLILENFFSLPEKELGVMFESVFNFVKINDSAESQKEFILSTTEMLNEDYYHKFMDIYIKVLGVTETLKTDEFNTVFVESFNKVISEDLRAKEVNRKFLWLAVQSGQEVVDRAVMEGITSEVRGHAMAEVLGQLQPLCDATSGTHGTVLTNALYHLLDSLADLPESSRTNFSLFVRELTMRKVLNGEDFLKNLFNIFHKYLKAKNLTLLVVCLETIQELLDIDCTYQVLTTLVMLVFGLQHCRWTPATFSQTSVTVCELTLQLINQYVIKCMEHSPPETELKNTVDLAKEKIKPLNRYYLAKLVPSEEMPTEDLALQLVYRMHYGVGEWSVLNITPEHRVKLVYSLCFVLPLLTTTEWQELFCVTAPKCAEFIALLDIAIDSLLLCIDSAKMKREENVLNCLLLAISNATLAVKYELNRWTKSDIEYRTQVLKRLCQVLCALPEDLQENQGLRMLKVMKALLPEGTRSRPLDYGVMVSVTAAIASLQSTTVRSSLSRSFLDMVHR